MSNSHVRIARLYLKGPPLQGSDSSPDDPLVDFPFRETDVSPSSVSPRRQERFDETSPGVADPGPEPTPEPPLFALSGDTPRHRSSFGIWLAAAAALVFGIGLGFFSGYRAARTGSSVTVGGIEKPASTSGAGHTFSESSVSEPVKLDPEPVVAAPEPAAQPAPQPQPPKAPAAVRRVPPQTQAVTADTPALKTLPASERGTLLVVSRPAGAQVVMDDRSIGRTPMTIPEVTVGEHSIRLELPGFKSWATTADVKAGSATRVAASLEQ